MVINRSDRSCNDCGSTLLIDHRKDVYLCKSCEKAWLWENLEDWPDQSTMPIPTVDYEEYS